MSKFTGLPSLDSVLVVRRDNPTEGLGDLEGSRYGYINKSCSSSYFPPAIMLNDMGRGLDFLNIVQVTAWQGQIDAVLSGEVRATMVPGDVWRTTPTNADTTKIIARIADTKPPVVVVRDGFDQALRAKLLEQLLDWLPTWSAVYGGFKPYYLAEMQYWFHQLDKLPKGL